MPPPVYLDARCCMAIGSVAALQRKIKGPSAVEKEWGGVWLWVSRSRVLTELIYLWACMCIYICIKAHMQNVPFRPLLWSMSNHGHNLDDGRLDDERQVGEHPHKHHPVEGKRQPALKTEGPWGETCFH